ncbi:WD40 repeat domain-containing protein [Streptomyces lasalocidi]
MDGPHGPEAAGVLRGHTGTVYALAFLGTSDEGTLAASGGDDGTVRVWDVERLVPHRVLPGQVREVRALSPLAGPGGRTLLAVAGRASRISVVDPYGGSLRSVLTNRMATLPEEFGSRSATGAQVVPVDWERLASHAQGRSPGSGGTYALTALRTGQGRGLFASAGWDGAVRLWAPGEYGPSTQPDYDSRRARRIVAFPQSLDSLSWGLVVAGSRGGAWLTDVQGGEPATVWPDRSLVDHVAPLVLPDGRPIVVLAEHESSRLRLVDVETREEVPAGETVASLCQLKGTVTSLETAAAPGWMTALVVNYDNATPQALLWLPGDRIHVLHSFEKLPVTRAVPCLSPQAEPFLAAVTDGGMILRESPSADMTEGVGGPARPPVPGLSPVAVRMPSGHWQLAVPRQDPDHSVHALDLWDLQSGHTQDCGREFHHDGTLLTHLTRLTRVDQDLVVGTCSDHTLRVWNPARPGREPLTIPLPGPARDLTATALDLVYVLIAEHWFALRLTGLGTVLSN